MYFISPLYRQYVFVIIASSSNFLTGLGINWSSPMVAKLTDRNSTVLYRPLTEEEATWVTSVLTLIIPSAILVPSLLNRLGRRNTVVLAYAPKLVACLLLVFAKKAWHLILARYLEGFAMNLFMVAVPTYVSEIADKRIRGTLGSLVQIFISLGVLTMMAVGPFLSYRTINVGYAIITVICFLPLAFLPESPYFLYSKGKTEESIKLLNSLRMSEDETQEELQMYEDIMMTKSGFCQAIRKKHVLKALGISAFIGFAAQLTGFNFISFYFQTMMASTNTIPASLASPMFGLVQLLFCGVPTLIADRVGRKPVLCVTTALIGVGMAGMGTFFWLQRDGETVGFLKYVPLLATILVNIGFSAGFGSITFIILPELFDGPERGLGVSTGVTSISLCCFVINKSYSSLISILGPAATYWLFCGCSLINSLLIWIFVPETKGKLFNEIQEGLKSKK